MLLIIAVNLADAGNSRTMELNSEDKSDSFSVSLSEVSDNNYVNEAKN